MLSLITVLVLHQAASNVMVVDPTFQSNKVTTTAVSAKRGLDVNCLSGCSGGGSSGDGGTTTSNQGLSNDGGFNWHVDVGQWGGVDTTLGQKVMTSSVPVTFASDQSALACTQSGTWTVQQGTPPWSVTGTKTNNAAAPGATNVGALMCLANAAAPTYTEGNLVLASVDLSGRMRTDTSSVAGTATSTGNGVAGAGVQRVVIASDQTAYSVNAIQSGAWSVSNTQVGTASQNVAQFGGSAVVTGTGASGAGIPRMTMSNDSSLAANQSVNVNQIAGTGTAVNNGTASAGTQRVVIASDQTAFTVNARVNDSSGNGVESAITEVVGTNRGLVVRPVDKTLTAPVITAVSCGTTSTALPTTAGRKSICIENEGNGDIYIGPTGVTTATGLPIATGATWCDDVGSQAYFCINASGTNDVRVLEN